MSAVMKKGYPLGLTEEWTLQNWENKVFLGYPSNGPFTQSIWRPFEYVGCYIATSTNQTKPYQSAVCYHTKLGNCAMAGAAGNTTEMKATWAMKVTLMTVAALQTALRRTSTAMAAAAAEPLPKDLRANLRRLPAALPVGLRANLLRMCRGGVMVFDV